VHIYSGLINLLVFLFHRFVGKETVSIERFLRAKRSQSLALY